MQQCQLDLNAGTRRQRRRIDQACLILFSTEATAPSVSRIDGHFSGATQDQHPKRVLDRRHSQALVRQPDSVSWAWQRKAKRPPHDHPWPLTPTSASNSAICAHLATVTRWPWTQRHATDVYLRSV